MTTQLPQVPFVVALTGGIASGKTTVSDLFQSLGVDVIDTDLIARELLQPGTDCYKAVVRAFGQQVLNKTQQIDRAKLRNIIFNDEESRSLLNSIMHPSIIATAERRSVGATSDYCVVVIPLLAGIGVPTWIDRILVVDAPVEAQLERLKLRDGQTDSQNLAAINSQSSREQRLNLADDVISNTGSIADLEIRVLQLHNEYLGYSKTKVSGAAG